MITNIDSNGRIQLPLAIRYGLHLLPGDKIAVDQLGDGTIILKKIEEREYLDVAEISNFGIMQPAHS
jgi:AbrB family looped-hinge helix DNA binding protein